MFGLGKTSDRKRVLNRLATVFTVVFCLFSVCPPVSGESSLQGFFLPAPRTLIAAGGQLSPAVLRGVTVFPDQPFRMDFLVDPGNVPFAHEDLIREETLKSAEYFLAALTVPEKDLWVNLSPFEQDRTIPEAFGKTRMGRDLLAQDYLLKQLTASLMYPENKTGKRFWDTVYRKAYQLFGTTDIPVNTYNKVWITPDKAEIYQNGNTVYIVQATLKVLLEEDYVAKTKGVALGQTTSGMDGLLSSRIVREIVIPEIEREVNEGENFMLLRQIYHAMILAAWYKQALKQSILTSEYADRNKVNGIILDGSEAINQVIYQQYVEAYRKGTYNIIKEQEDPNTGELVPRKYFSGGFSGALQLTYVSLPFSVIRDAVRHVAVYFKNAPGPHGNEKRPHERSLDFETKKLESIALEFRTGNLTETELLHAYKAFFEESTRDQDRIYILENIVEFQLLSKAPWLWSYLADQQTLVYAHWFQLYSKAPDRMFAGDSADNKEEFVAFLQKQAAAFQNMDILQMVKILKMSSDQRAFDLTFWLMKRVITQFYWNRESALQSFLVRLYRYYWIPYIREFSEEDFKNISMRCEQFLSSSVNETTVHSLPLLTEGQDKPSSVQENLASVDSSMITEDLKGGIDFDPSQLDFNLSAAGIDNGMLTGPQHIDGLIPVILNIQRVPNLPQLLGLPQSGNTSGSLARISSDP